MRNIIRIVSAQKINMGGIILDQALPVAGIDQIDPFLLIHHWRSTYKGGDDPLQIGVGPHPHRGFAPVTLIFEGGIHHRDSIGNSSVVMKGGTQWMNSGHGIIHSERPTVDIAKNGGVFEIIQFWVNAPSTKKMDQPNYQPLSYEDTPKIVSPQKQVEIGLVAGDLADKKGRIDTYSPLRILRVKSTGAEENITLDIPRNFNALWYQLDGQSKINGKVINAKDMVIFDNFDDTITFDTLSEGNAIILSGQPINEPVATYGPFVMNTQQEIVQAIQDYQSGKMGRLIETYDE